MSVIRVTQRARDILEAGFPGLKGFAEPRFRAAETDYKRAASEKAQTWFSRSALETLIRDEPEALTKRVRDLAGETNLLFLAVPKRGDLALLYADGLNVTELVEQLLELLHGPGDSESRRVCRRLHQLRGWGHEKERTVLPRSAGAGSSDGFRSRARVQLTVVGDLLYFPEDRVYS